MQAAPRLRIDRDIDRVMDRRQDGRLLLTLLGCTGWHIDQQPFEGGWLVTGTRLGDSFAMYGDTIADIAVPFFKAASAIAYAQEHAKG